MKMEKINDSQIRFILTREDLEKRQIKLTELAYGTDKARKLFQDMLQEANAKYGFDVSNVPLMVEAVPMSGDNIVLVVTKADSPEELDTRYANFAPSVDRSGSTAGDDAGETGGTLDQLIDSIRRTASSSGAISASGGTDRKQNRNATAQRREEYMKLREYIMMHRLYVFENMDSVISAARHVHGQFTGTSTLLQDSLSHRYYLFLTMKNMEEVSSMQSVLAAVSEYGTMEPASYAREQQLAEHCRTLIAGDALQVLAGI